MRAAAPTHAEAMKAVLTDERFSDPDWIFERKLDGIRCMAMRDGARVKLLSRNDLSLNERYPEIAEALEAERCDRFAVDGEVVAFDGAQTSFARLAQRGQRPRAGLPLRVRRAVAGRPRRARAAARATRKRLLRDALERSTTACADPASQRATARRSSRRPAARAGRG